MRWTRATSALDRFFFGLEPQASIVLLRTLWGALILVSCLLLLPEYLTWFGPEGLTPPEMVAKFTPGLRINVFTLLPQTDAWAWSVLATLALAALALTLGWMPRLGAAACFVLLTSLHHRSMAVVNSGDTVMRLGALFLAFAPPGVAWGRRLFQLQFSLIYVLTVLHKLKSLNWRDGSMLYYVFRMEDFYRFPVPEFLKTLTASRFLTPVTLATELALGTLIWIPKLRYPVLLAGIAMHLGIEYAMNIPLFEWLMIAGLLSHVPPADWARLRAWASRTASQDRGRPAPTDPRASSGSWPWYSPDAKLASPGSRGSVLPPPNDP